MALLSEELVFSCPKLICWCHAPYPASASSIALGIICAAGRSSYIRQQATVGVLSFWIRQLSELKNGKKITMEKMAGSSRRESANEVNDRPNCPAESKLQVRLCLCVRAHGCVCVCVCECVMANTWRTIKQLNAKSTWRAKKVNSTRPATPPAPKKKKKTKNATASSTAPNELKWESKMECSWAKCQCHLNATNAPHAANYCYYCCICHGAYT